MSEESEGSHGGRQLSLSSLISLFSLLHWLTGLLRWLAGLDGRVRPSGRCRCRRLHAFQRQFDAGEVSRVGLGRHLDLVVAGNGAIVVDGHAVEGDVEGEFVGVDFAVADGYGIE